MTSQANLDFCPSDLHSIPMKETKNKGQPRLTQCAQVCLELPALSIHCIEEVATAYGGQRRGVYENIYIHCLTRLL